MSERRFSQVDVFSSEPMMGNALAVVHEAEGLSEDEMAAFARWTNLSETTFLLPAGDAAADYRVRIFTPGGELPFAGHPTLGSAHAWLEAGGVPRHDDVVMQECGIGLVPIRRTGGGLAFAAPQRLRQGPVAEELLEQVAAGLGLERTQIVAAEWCDNGPEWIGVRLADAAAVLALEPDPAALGDLKVGVVGTHPTGECAIEVRAFAGGIGVVEDPVTGSLNAALAQWLIGSVLPDSYVASQGTAIGRRGRVHITTEGETIWVGGETRTTIHGTVGLG